jgi:hypothetical protein
MSNFGQTPIQPNSFGNPFSLIIQSPSGFEGPPGYGSPPWLPNAPAEDSVCIRETTMKGTLYGPIPYSPGPNINTYRFLLQLVIKICCKCTSIAAQFGTFEELHSAPGHSNGFEYIGDCVTEDSTELGKGITRRNVIFWEQKVLGPCREGLYKDADGKTKRSKLCEGGVKHELRIDIYPHSDQDKENIGALTPVMTDCKKYENMSEKEKEETRNTLRDNAIDYVYNSTKGSPPLGGGFPNEKFKICEKGNWKRKALEWIDFSAQVVLPIEPGNYPHYVPPRKCD